MDYQFLCVLKIILIVLVAHLHFADAIVGRDVVLTPKRDLQLRGKSIFYEEEASATTTHNQTLLRPWERTLKHVTFVTLFTNAAADAAAGNVSQQNAYSNFLLSPYIPQQVDSDTRFGDIVTLAIGRLEETGNNSFRFVEGLCGYDCDAEHVRALWQIQKIRHRDANRKFRYEMKFSVSPLRTESAGNIKRKAELESNNSKRSVLQTYIQRDDDYPKTFGKIVYNDETRFADRRLDEYAGRNFRQAPMNSYRQATPMPQPTFMHGIFQPAPHFPPLPEKLNIGEYIKDYTPKAPPKIELFPNIINAVSRNYYPTPTTFRPNYQKKFPRPELYTPTEVIKFPQNSQVTGVGGDGGSKLSTPVVTHHFHHHFYMPTTTSIENGLGSAEQPINKPTNAYKSVAPETTAPTYFTNYYNERVKANYQEVPQSQKLINFANSDTEVHKEHVVQVTPVPPLKRPQIYQMYQIPIDAKVPLLIYPAPVVEAQPTSPHNTPFIRSEPMDDEHIRYSEPDPLYLNLAHNPPLDEQSYELGAPQLEAPKINQFEEYADVHISTVTSRKSTKPDSIAAQLPPPDSDQDVRIPYEDETDETLEASKHKNDLEQKPSQKDVHISVKKKLNSKIRETTSAPAISSTTAEIIETSSNTPDLFTTTTSASTSTSTTTTTERFTTSDQLESINTSVSAVQTTTMPTTNSLHSATTAMPSTTSIDGTEVSTKQNKSNFVSTSTSETPSLRAISRYRLKHIRASTTTTEQPVLKWKPRRKHAFNSKTSSNSNVEAVVLSETRTTKREQPQEAKTANAQRQEKQLTTAATTNSIKTANDSSLTTSGKEVFEVLTQKSISRSVSIKVGNNGEEIPVIIDDGDYGDNEVKTD